jgi:sec-independent protein translocase protein TatA
MPSLGPAEILVILVVALLVFGPHRMPEIGRQLARGVRELRRVQHHLGSELRDVVSEFDLDDDDDHADDRPTATTTRPGGDPVPTLPAKSVEATPVPPQGSAADANGESSPPAQPSDST